MSSQSSSSSRGSASGGRSSAGRGTAAPGEYRAPATDALAGDVALAADFWRARAEELAARVTHLEQRLAALSEHLPLRWAQLLVCDPDQLPEHAYWPDPLAGWHETTSLEPARVASVLPRLWDRLESDASR